MDLPAELWWKKRVLPFETSADATHLLLNSDHRHIDLT